MSGNEENERRERDRDLKRRLLRDLQRDIEKQLDRLRNQIKECKRRLFIMHCTLNPIHREDSAERITQLRDTYEVEFELEKEAIEEEIARIEHKMTPLREAAMKIRFEIEELVNNPDFFNDWF